MGARALPGLMLLVGLMVCLWPLGFARAQAALGVPRRGILMRCEPGYVVLGGGRQAQVRLELDPEATDLELLASEGEVGPLTRVGPGVFLASYVPPRRSLPLEVILVALARGPRGPLEGWTVLPLWGQGQAEVRTRAGVPVTLQVEERTFGPILADATGLARVPVEVPPGTREAFFGQRRIDLGVPPWPLLHAVPSRRQVRADREETVDIRLYTSRLPGASPRPGALTFSVSRGSVSAPTETEPGVFLVRWTVPPGPLGRLELKGTMARNPGVSPSVRLEAVSGPARRFEMRVDREELVASERTQVGVEVFIRDVAGNPAPAGLRLDADLALEGAFTERRPGEYAGTFTLPARFGGREQLELRLYAEGSATPVGTRTLRLRAATLARIQVEPLREVLVADGLQEAAWRISVEDRFGNLVGGTWPETRLAEGQGTLRADVPGRYELRYVPAAASVERRSEVEVRVGDVLGRSALSLLRRSVVSLAPRVGLVTNFADVRAPSAGLRLEVWPVRSLPALGLWLDTGYLRFTRTGGTVVPGFLGRNELLDTTLAVGLRSPREYGLQGWVAAGLAVARVHGHATWGEGRVLDEGTWVLGAQAMAGAGVRWGPGLPFVEARVCWFDDPSLGVLRGALRGGGLHLGYRLELF